MYSNYPNSGDNYSGQYQNFSGDNRVTHLQRHVLQEIIEQYLMQNCGIRVSCFEKIDEFPEMLRHSCVATGVTFLSRNTYTLPQGYDVQVVPVYFCQCCGKVYLPANLQDC